MEFNDNDLIPCTILQIIQPNLLMIALEDSDELSKKIEELEKKLTAQWDHLKTTSSGTSLPSIDTHVAYKEESRRGCRRGIVKNIRPISNVYRYRIILYDYGLDREVELHELMIIKDTTNEVIPRCKILQIPGIVPACLNRDIALEKEYKEKFVEGKEWTEASLQGAKNWAKDRLKTCQVVIQRYVSTLFVEGDLFSFDERHRLMHKSYSDFLCDSNFALLKIIKKDKGLSIKTEKEEEEVLDWKTQAQSFGGLLADVFRSDGTSQKENKYPSSSSSEPFVNWEITSEEYNTVAPSSSSATTTTVQQKQSLKLNSEGKTSNNSYQEINKTKTENKSSEAFSPAFSNQDLDVTETVNGNNSITKVASSSPPLLKLIPIPQKSPLSSSTTTVKSGDGLQTNTQNTVGKTVEREKQEPTKGQDNNSKPRSHLFSPVEEKDWPNPYAAIVNREKKPSLTPDHINHNLPQNTKKKKQKDNSSFDYAPINGIRPSNIDKEEEKDLQTRTTKVVPIQSVSSETSPNFKKINKEYKQKEATRPQSNPTLKELSQVSNQLKSNPTYHINSSSGNLAETIPRTSNTNNRVSNQSNSLQSINRPHSCTPETQKPQKINTAYKEKDLILPKEGKIKRYRSPEEVNEYIKSSKEAHLNNLVYSSSEAASSEKSVDESEVTDKTNMFQRESKKNLLVKSNDDGKTPETTKEEKREEKRVQNGMNDSGRGGGEGSGSTSTTKSHLTTSSVLFGKKQSNVESTWDKSVSSSSVSSKVTVITKSKIEIPEEIPRHTTVVYQSRINESSTESKDDHFKNMAKGRIFVHGLGQSAVPAYKSMQEFPLLETMKNGIAELQIKKFNCLLNNVIPNIMRGRNCIIIDKEKGGKSLAYMIPTVANIMTDSDRLGESWNSSQGAVGVFVTASLASGEKLMNHLENLLKSKKFKVSSHFISEINKKAQSELKKGLDIIITTPECLYQLMETCLLNYQRLKYFVLDDCDILLQTKIDMVVKIMELLQSCLTKLGSRSNSLQTIFCGSKWTQQLESIYLNVIDNPVACLGEVQAIVFGKIKPKAYYAASIDKKVEHLIERLDKTIKKYYKVIIFCKEDVFTMTLQKEIHDKLKLHAPILTRSGDEDISSSFLGATLEQWKQASESAPEIIICTDPFVKELQIYDATHIIHFEVPSKQSIFGARFCALWKWLKGPENTEPTKCACTLYITPSETPKAVVRLVSHLKQMESTISPDLNQYYLNVKQELDRNLEFCPGLTWHGQCENFDPTTCKYRHFIIPLEDTARFDAVPKTGEVEIRIVACKTVCSYVAQLVRHYEVSDGKVIPKLSYTQYLKGLTRELDEFYSKEENRIPVTEFKSKCFLATSNEDGSYMRYSVDDMISPGNVRLFGIDTGEHCVRNIGEGSLYVLPDHFKSKTRLAIELIVANMKPMFGERHHRIEYTRDAKNLVGDKILKGRICLSIGNRIWVDQLVEQKRDESGTIRNITSFRPKFFKKKLAEDNPSHMEQLYELFENAGISCEHYRKSRLDDVDPELDKELHQCYQLNDRIQWAHLDIHQNYNEVSLWCTYVHPDCSIYAIQKNYIDQLDDVEKKLNAEVMSFKEKYLQTSTQLKKYYTVDMIVAVKDVETGNWVRGMIANVHEEDLSSTEEVFYDVLLVDTGELLRQVDISELCPISIQLVQKLPFQAIAVKLNHVKPKNSSENCWSPETFNFLSHYIIQNDSTSSGIVNAVVLEKTSDCMTSTWPWCNSYHTMIFQMNENYEVGKKLVEEGHAEYEVGGEELLNRVQNAILKNINRDLKYLDVEDIESDYSSDGDCETDNEYDVYVDDETKVLKQLGIDFSPIDKSNSKAILPSSPSSSFDHYHHDECKVSPSSEELKIPPTSPSKFQQMYPGIKSPEIEWKQTDEYVLLRVLIPDIKNFEHELGSDKKLFTFRTIEPSGYGFQIELFKRVQMKMEIVMLGQYTKITFTKRMSKVNWDHLYNGPKTLKVSRIYHENDFEDEEEDVRKSRVIPSLLNSDECSKSVLHSVYGDSDSDDSESDYDEDLDEIIG